MELLEVGLKHQGSAKMNKGAKRFDIWSAIISVFERKTNPLKMKIWYHVSQKSYAKID